jgi:hypothetical protein
MRIRQTRHEACLALTRCATCREVLLQVPSILFQRFPDVSGVVVGEAEEVGSVGCGVEGAM